MKGGPAVPQRDAHEESSDEPQIDAESRLFTARLFTAAEKEAL